MKTPMKDSLKGVQPNDNASIEWLNSKADKRKRNTYRVCWVMFLKFTGMTGNQILADRQIDCQQETYRWEHKIMEFKDWMLQQPLKTQRNEGTIEYQSSNSAKTAVAVARGFFSYHHKTLQLRRHESEQLKKGHRKTEDYKFSREDLKKMAEHGDLKEQYVVVAGKSFGLRASDFLNLKRGDLSPYINYEPPISIGCINTIKESVPAYPFIDSDAQPVIKHMLEQLAREGRTNPSEKMLKYKYEKELTQVLKRLAKEAGDENFTEPNMS